MMKPPVMADVRGTPVWLERLFAGIIGWRVPIVVGWLLLLLPAGWLITRLQSEGAIERLVVEQDPDVALTRQFHEVFPEGRQVVLLFQPVAAPFSPAAVTELAGIEDALRAIPGVVATSALSIYRRQEADLASPGHASRYQAFASGTDFFSKQGLVGEHHVSLAVTFTAPRAAERDAQLDAIDRAVAQVPHPNLGEVKRVGEPYVSRWLESETRSATARYMPLFGVFVVVLMIALYRSWRALVAILVTLGVTVALSMGLGALFGFTLTIVSELVPLVVLVTTTATLVYLHSRYIQQPLDVPLEQHHPAALANKALPVSASILAALLGFAALAVSKIPPIREMGVWTAAGLVVCWLTSLTLFPALQRMLKAPTRPGHVPGGRIYTRFTGAIPYLTYRFRWLFLALAALVSVAGGVALFGFPGGLVAPMKLEIRATDYLDPTLPLRKDLLDYETNIAGLSAVRLWVKTPEGEVLEPELLHGLDRFTTAVGQEAGVTSVIGPTTLLRLRRYLSRQNDTLPEDAEGFAAATADLEQLLLSEQDLRAFIDVKTLSQAQVMVIARQSTPVELDALVARIQALWTAEQQRTPALEGSTAQAVGQSILQARITTHLVPTLVESFGLTAVLIFLTFLVVFRSGAARLMAMVPSVFAILATFLVMRLLDIPLNIATILIATTVLGTTENDQVHFFHHYQEARNQGASAEQSLAHTLAVSGHAILFATLINTSGFLALTFSGLPPVRQFGVVSSIAFLLALLADFTALPAALWIFLRAKPDAPGTAKTPLTEP